MLKDFGPVLKILVRFIIIYLVLLGLYQFYLNIYLPQGLDPYSYMIAEHANWFQERLGYPSFLVPDPANAQAYYGVIDRKVTRMVEGCNAISVIILFLAFIFAFYKGITTFKFAAVSLIILYVMNIVRISAFNLVMYDHKEYGKMFHDYIFPSIIYGTVVVLWLVWIQFFVLKDEKR